MAATPSLRMGSLTELTTQRRFVTVMPLATSSDSLKTRNLPEAVCSVQLFAAAMLHRNPPSCKRSTFEMAQVRKGGSESGRGLGLHRAALRRGDPFESSVADFTASETECIRLLSESGVMRSLCWRLRSPSIQAARDAEQAEGGKSPGYLNAVWLPARGQATTVSQRALVVLQGP